jgi:hypothetical protein
VYGGTIHTPRIDQLANEGIRFNNYNVEAQCTPTRSAILTGRHPVRSGTFKVPFPGQGLFGMSPWEYTLAELLSDAGYATALYGKWHVGEHEGRLPNNQGFDEWWGIMNSWDEAGYTAWPLFKESGIPIPMIWEGKKGEPSKPVMPLDLNVRPILDGNYIIPKTVEYIKRNAAAKKPFFVYVGYSEMHPPVIGNSDFVGKSTQRGGLFADIIGEMGYHVGQILDAVKEAGVDDNTIVILSSDNAGGGAVLKLGPGSNRPWRGDFLNTPSEGSMRAPAIIRSPGAVGRQEVITASDLFTPEELDRDAFQREFLDRFGLRWFSSFGAIHLDQISPVVLTLERAVKLERFSRSEVEQISAVVPHIQRASRFSLAVAAAAAAGIMAGLDHVNRASILLDDLGLVVRMNGAAEHLMGHGLTVSNRKLRASTRDGDRLPQKLIAIAAANKPPHQSPAP